jgi:predicted RND superfamily exporter protein
MKKLGMIIAKTPKLAVVAIIIITLILGYFATRAEQETDWRNYLPDNEIVNTFFLIYRKIMAISKQSRYL